MRKRLTILITAALALATAACGDAGEQQLPWWKQEKIRFMWGQWNHERLDLEIDYWGMDRKRGRDVDIELPRQLFRDLARAGVTVFVEQLGYRPQHARYCREFGMKYFACRYVITLHELPGRSWVNAEGERADRRCSLDQEAYEKWIFEARNEESIFEGVRDGLIDGIQFDWEGYGGRPEPGLCYCQDCLARFPGFADAGEPLPPADRRDEWLEARGLTKAFREHFHQRRMRMFTSIREKLQAVKPDLLFASYDMLVTDFSKAMHTREAPFIISDAQHYFNDQRQPWWVSYGSVLRDRGYLYIPGAWANGLFGSQASDVSAARWIYEAAINEDGAWIWFERELDDEILRAYAAADREIQAVVGKVGRYLFRGERDSSFVTAVEWTGRPTLERAVRCQTYHRDDDHLVHVSNLHTEWPLRVTLRFPRLSGPGAWIVRDAMRDLTYAQDFGRISWTAEDLAAGVSVALEPRDDIFLLLSPADRSVEPDSASIIHSRSFEMLTDHSSPPTPPGPVGDLSRLYKLKNAVYGDELPEARLEPFLALPRAGWRFRMDPDDAGAEESWFQPGFDAGDWQPIEIESFWDSQGGKGAGWYKADVEIPELPDGRQMYLHFGAVDEELVMWINGEYAGDYNQGPAGWDTPFAIDVTGKLRSGANHLALRVYNSAAAGGVHKPISVMLGERTSKSPELPAEPAGEAEPSPQLVYTATESMGMRGATARLSIANAIRTTSVDGERHLRLRQLRGHLWGPAWSPDGERILFVQDVGGKGQIHVMNADGSEVRDLSSNEFCDRSPAWSPDGNRIAFVSDRTADWDVYVMNADGGEQRRVAGQPGRDLAPAWSPDGRMLAWESHTAGRPDVWVCDADGRNARSVLQPGRTMKYFAWEGGKPTAVEPIMRSHEVYLKKPVWSPDGTRVAGTGLWKYSMCYVLAVDGSRLDLLAAGGVAGADNLCWSPDGSRLAGSFATAPQETERAGVFVLDAATGATRLLINAKPLGPRRGEATRRVEQSWNSHGSAQPRRVVKTFTGLTWSPDGQALAFSSDLDPTGAFYIYTIEPDAEYPQPVRLDHTLSTWPQQLGWRP